jgi:hypothetical protein
MTPILGDVRRDGRHLGRVMPPRLADLMPRVQPAGAAATRARGQVDHGLDTLGRHQCPMVPGMPRLPARRATTLHAPPPHARAPGEGIGGRRLRRGRGIQLAQRELPLQIGNPFRLLRHLLPQALVLPRHALDCPRRRLVSTRARQQDAGIASAAAGAAFARSRYARVADPREVQRSHRVDPLPASTTISRRRHGDEPSHPLNCYPVLGSTIR